MDNPAKLQLKEEYQAYFLVGMSSPARALSSSDDLAPVVSDWLFLFRLSAEAEEREMWPRLPAFLEDDAGAGRTVETPGTGHRVHVKLSE